MKVCTIILFFQVMSGFGLLTAGETGKNESSLQAFLKQRAEKYIQFSSTQDITDSAKVILANSLLETDNEIIGRYSELDSTVQEQAKQISVFKQRKELSRKGHLIARIAGSALLVLFGVSLVMLFVIWKKIKRTRAENITVKAKIESCKTELNALQEKKDAEEAQLEAETEKTKNEAEGYREKLTLAVRNIEELVIKSEGLEKKNQELEQLCNSHAARYADLSKETGETNSLCNELKLQNNRLISIKSESENKIFALTEEIKQHENEHETLFSDCMRLTEENKGFTTKMNTLETEKNALQNEIRSLEDGKSALLNRLYLLEDERYDLKAKLPEYEISAIREMVEKNMETLRLANMKIQSDKEKLEKALRMREPEDKLAAKINKLVEENYNLQLDIEDEKAYSAKLNEKLDKYLDELEKQDLELELLNMKVKDRTTPGNRVKFDEMELNLVKIEKLNRLKEYHVITEEEFQNMKQDIISQL